MTISKEEQEVSEAFRQLSAKGRQAALLYALTLNKNAASGTGLYGLAPKKSEGESQERPPFAGVRRM